MRLTEGDIDIIVCLSIALKTEAFREELRKLEIHSIFPTKYEDKED